MDTKVKGNKQHMIVMPGFHAIWTKVLVTITQISHQGDQKLTTINLLCTIYANLSVRHIIFWKTNAEYLKTESETLPR